MLVELNVTLNFGKSGVQFRVDRHDPALGSIVPSHMDRRQPGIQGQVEDLEYQGLGYPESGSPLDQKQKACSGVRSRLQERVNLRRRCVLPWEDSVLLFKDSSNGKNTVSYLFCIGPPCG